MYNIVIIIIIIIIIIIDAVAAAYMQIMSLLYSSHIASKVRTAATFLITGLETKIAIKIHNYNAVISNFFPPVVY